MSTSYTHSDNTPTSRGRDDYLVDAMNRGPRITGGWSGERQVLIPSFIAAAVAVGAMFFLEKMF